jgi:hypothetical protein
MRSYDEAVVASVPAPPWDTNRDANRWYEQWCGQCRYDVDADGVDGERCPLLMPAEPPPAPVLPGQLDILGVFVDRIVDEVSR